MNTNPLQDQLDHAHAENDKLREALEQMLNAARRPVSRHAMTSNDWDALEGAADAAKVALGHSVVGDAGVYRLAINLFPVCAGTPEQIRTAADQLLNAFAISPTETESARRGRMLECAAGFRSGDLKHVCLSREGLSVWIEETAHTHAPLRGPKDEAVVL